MMTPEALSAYLIAYRFDEDVVQDTLVKYLTSPVPIEHPKTWAWKVASRLAGKARRKSGRTTPLNSIPVLRASDSSSNPLKQAVDRQELSKALLGAPKVKAGMIGVKGRQKEKMWGLNRVREDYRILLESDHYW